MKTLLDVHTHTIASGHAFSSLQEMTLTAKEKGLNILGITEHGPNIPGTCDPIYFRNLHCVPRQLYGIKLMLGAELNILNTKGDIDLDEDYWRMLDIRIAGIHSLCWQGGSKEENTQGVINAMRNPFVQIISHPGDGTAELDFVLQKGNQIVGVEVKKGEHVRSRSLSVFVDSYKPAYSVRLSLKNFGEKDGLKSVPLYAAFCV